MKKAFIAFGAFCLLLNGQDSEVVNLSDVRPTVTKDDIRIVQRAREILNSSAKWNRADNRECPPGARTYSLYCVLEKATEEVSGKFEHRGAAMQGHASRSTKCWPRETTTNTA